MINLKIIVENIEYELEKQYKNGFDKEEFLACFTDYFEPYDYILGDWSYGKLRLKGFSKKGSKNYNKYNDIATLESYLKDHCAYDCKYFILKKLNENK